MVIFIQLVDILPSTNFTAAVLASRVRRIHVIDESRECEDEDDNENETLHEKSFCKPHDHHHINNPSSSASYKVMKTTYREFNLNFEFL